MSKLPTYYGTQALGRAVGVSDKTALRFLWFHPRFKTITQGPRTWRKLDEAEFADAIDELKKLQAIQPHHPLRALKTK